MRTRWHTMAKSGCSTGMNFSTLNWEAAFLLQLLTARTGALSKLPQTSVAGPGLSAYGLAFTPTCVP